MIKLELDFDLNEETIKTEKNDLVIKNVIKDELKIGLKNYIKDVLNNYITYDFKTDLKTELKNKVEPEIKSRIIDDISNEIEDDVKKNIIKDVKKEITFDINKYFEEKSKIFIKVNDTINADKLQNKSDCNEPNCIVSIQNNGKIFPNIIFTKGMIIAWFGEISKIPENWAICDGTHGTPDLRDRFIIGSDNEINLGKSGGKKEITITKNNLPKLGKGYFSCDSHNGNYHYNPQGLIKKKELIPLVWKMDVLMIGVLIYILI